MRGTDSIVKLDSHMNKANSTVETIDSLQLETKRLLLRTFQTSLDSNVIHDLLQERDIAYNTQMIPFPYEKGMAEDFIHNAHKEAGEGKGLHLAVILKSETNLLIGVVSLIKIEKNNEHQRANLGYWIGKPYWGLGYGTEAASEIIRFGFMDLHLDYIRSNHFARNPASGRIMQKNGMKHETQLKKKIEKWGVWEDVEEYGLLRKDFVENK
uniref:N-acetyltransferase domain-containing protein n=1 Tax=Attheya septentrionalis TaxID=420275 RepID=A0A7S2XTP7_9STRA|mmetsp:Transcript_7633/g.13767  ORF Transcript_7633/g.13767 Transcript_7633/m.13767 type:complete len:211 (+) Transcript_7633:95-727(+)